MTGLHYELTDETITTPWGVTLHRIRALKDLPCCGVKAGDIGGFIETTENLYGDAWVFGAAQVSGAARVYGDARVSGDARVYGAAWVSGDARVSGAARVYERQHILCIGPIGSESVHITLARTADGHLLKVGCWDGQLAGLPAEVERRARDWGGSPDLHAQWRAEYEAAGALLALRIDAWHPAKTVAAGQAVDA